MAEPEKIRLNLKYNGKVVKQIVVPAGSKVYLNGQQLSKKHIIKKTGCCGDKK